MTILTNNDHEQMVRVPEETINVAEAKKQLSTLLGRVAFGKETILIMRRGRPMARLIPPDDEPVEPGLGAVRGWLSGDDPFLAAVDEIVTARVRHRPRVVSPRKRVIRKR
ncbi:MAG TPA: type II toxin-antitoxin system Phd/YefM family antitoxin [Thermoanaerobaculia bacterium]|nr:type II toxin-antitoxin system Phd/YefM family antitoxin [Thermoanaerobaculia bacterium]